MKCIIYTIVLILLFLSGVSIAYEPGTHQRLSGISTSKSVLARKLPATNSTVLDDLGLKDYTDPSQLFPDSQAGEDVDLGPNGPKFRAKTPLDIEDLITTGAAIEDEGYRPFCHFFDPIDAHSQPLNVNKQYISFAASYDDPDWATGIATDICKISGTLLGNEFELGNELQRYSLKDADSYYYNALTMPNKDDRDTNYGNLFLSIGHTLHLLEDTAQPQHVRNDMHCDTHWCLTLYNPSRYEAYTFYNYTASDPSYIPDFPIGIDFWVSGDSKGIAEFTNQTFFSAGTLGMINGGNSDYLLPVLDGGSTEESAAQVYIDLGQNMPPGIASICSQPDSCPVTFYSTTGYDYYKDVPVTNSKAVTKSIFSSDLTSFGDPQLFVLNDVNYMQAEQLLFPMAISYGTGLINHFFRGRIDVQPDPQDTDTYLITNKVSYPMSGTITIYYDDATAIRHLVPCDSGCSNVTMAAAGNDPGDQISVKFTAPTDPTPANPGQYMFVFQGKIGTEDGIAGKFIATSYLYTSTSQACGTYVCGTIWAVTDDLNFNNIKTIDDVLSNNLAIYNGVDYELSSQFDPYPPSFHLPPNFGCDDTLARIHGVTFLLKPCWNESGDPVTTLNAIAVNTNNIYVAGTDNPGYVGYIYVYDHSGNYVQTLSNTPAAGLWSLAANDTRLCLAGWVNNGYDGGIVLTDLNGSAIATWPGDPDFGGGPCALTKDRAYVLAWCDLCDATLSAYDLDGNLISTQVIPESLYVVNITATDSHVYVSTACESTGESCSGYGVVMVFNRIVTYDSNHQIQSEQLVRQPDVAVPWVGPYTSTSTFWQYDLTADMKDVLGGNGGQ